MNDHGEETSRQRGQIDSEEMTLNQSPVGSEAEFEDINGHGGSIESKGQDDASRKDDDENIRSLAREYSRHSAYSADDPSPFHAAPGSQLDPDSEDFSPRAWAKAMLKLRNEDSERFMGRTAGVAFRNINVYGYGTPTDYQKTVASILLSVVGYVRKLTGAGTHRIDILRNVDGLMRAGELLVVLGPPGSGCSTFLKTISGETHGFFLDKDSHVNYQGIGWNQMHSEFRGEAIYTAEQDVHFPQLTVGDTLYFAARARAPRFIPGGVGIKQYANHMRDVIMATFGIRHTINTKVGNEYIRGVSGGERKRVSIAEAALSGAPLQCWDNSTRGLDSANAIEFCKSLRIQADVGNTAAAVAIYQSPQAAYDIFDKAIVLYEGRQIYFGSTKKARNYFINLGFECPDRQTDPDFLTSMTSAHERRVRPGFENRVPRTPDDFAAAWRNSAEYKALIEEIDEYEREHPIGGEDLKLFERSRELQQAKGQRLKSPYTLSYGQQVNLCLWRCFKRLVADPSLTLTQLFGNFIISLIIGSVFYNLSSTTGSFFSRSALLFFATLMSAFSSALEILILYAQRPIVEKHTRYALYHPSAEAFASALSDMPYKIVNCISFNLTLYFMANLRREPGAFFFFLLFSFMITLTMSMIFRTIASVSRTLEQAMVPASFFINALVIYTGFSIPTTYMLGWSRWINYLDPVAYGFEALMANEFAGRNFDCSTIVPSYGSLQYGACNTVGSVAGQSFVSGDVYLDSAYRYSKSHRWRNFGILWGFMLSFFATYLCATEYIQAKKSKGEVLVFRRGRIPATMKKNFSDDPEAASTGAEGQVQNREEGWGAIQKQTAIFQWQGVCYDIKIKGEPRRILDQVDGWVKPGTLTALMGVSGAGKTTLLDVLATRVTMGVVTGEVLVDGMPRDSSFQRKAGYVQQQDLHLATSTVREALTFSALLRQPAHVPREEKIAYVDEVIKLLEMEEYADAVVGILGEGLNVEQRKRLTIGVELAAKPELLLFLDEPTSGLDSQTSWSILSLLEKLKNSGQAILCTIHQPSAMLFQRFDRLLFLAPGGKTVYFGEIGPSSHTMIDYFMRNGAPPCPPDANPAEWMLAIIGAAPGSHSDIDWPAVWRQSPEYVAVHQELDRIRAERAPLAAEAHNNKGDQASYREFAAPFWHQYFQVQKRVLQQHWRTPSYVWSKFALCAITALFVGFSFFKAKNTIQGLQNQMFGLFMLLSIFGQLTQGIMPLFVTQRSLYEVRERPSKTYSWKVFMLSNIIGEVPWNLISASLLFFCWYYPIGLYRNAEPTNAVTERGGLMWLLVVAFLMFTSTFAHMVIAGTASAETGGNIANLMFMMTLIFCGVLASPTALPGFWIFMYRVSPFTYLVEAMLATGVGNADVTCAANEYLHFNPPPGQTCGAYMEKYINALGGYLADANATSACSYCSIAKTNSYLASLSASFHHAWRDFGLLWVYIAFNVSAALFLYWLVRVPKKSEIAKEQHVDMSAPQTEKKE